MICPRCDQPTDLSAECKACGLTACPLCVWEHGPTIRLLASAVIV